MPAFHESQERNVLCLLEKIGSLDILRAPVDWCMFSVKLGDATLFSRVVRIAGGDGEAKG